MTVKKKSKLILLVALPVVTFFLLFVPIVVGNQEQQIIYNAVGFRENSADPLELENSIMIHGRERLTILVHREWAVGQVLISTSAEARSVKAILKQRGQVDIILGEVENCTKATFGNKYSSENGEITYKIMALSNHLNTDTLTYYPMENIDVWIEIIVDVSEQTEVAIDLLSE